MKKIKLLMLLFLAASTQMISAQCTDEKYGCDTITTKNNLSNYDLYYKAKNYFDAYEPWKWLFVNAPKSTRNIYTQGPKILNNL